MIKTEKEEMLALRWAGVPEVPAPADENTPVWIYAIARVRLSNMRESYAIVAMDYGRDPKVIKSFSEARITEIISVHPYKFLDGMFVPKLESAAATKEYIANAYGVDHSKVASLKKPELMRLLYTHCIKRQLEHENRQSEKIDM